MSAYERLHHLRSVLECPRLLPTSYSTDDGTPGSTTRLNPSQVRSGIVPDQLRVARLDQLISPAQDALRGLLESPTFPDHLLERHSLVILSHEDAKVQANRIAPSGETGISHFLKSSLFDQLNRILAAIYPVEPQQEEERFWRVIGIGGAGKTDWGLFINGKLVVIVELKPSMVSSMSRVFIPI